MRASRVLYKVYSGYSDISNRLHKTKKPGPSDKGPASSLSLVGLGYVWLAYRRRYFSAFPAISLRLALSPKSFQMGQSMTILQVSGNSD